MRAARFTAAALAASAVAAGSAFAHDEVDAKEQAAFEAARPVFLKHCFRCHATAGDDAKPKSLKHFSMDGYPFGGHHPTTIAREIRITLGVTGRKPTMPDDLPGAVKGEELAKILAWADAFDAAHAKAAPTPRPTPAASPTPGPSPSPSPVPSPSPEPSPAPTPSPEPEGEHHHDMVDSPAHGDHHGDDHHADAPGHVAGDRHAAGDSNAHTDESGHAEGGARNQAHMAFARTREMLVPGTPGPAGHFHLMLNGFGHLQNQGLGDYTIRNPGAGDLRGGTTIPMLTDDWVMGYGRTKGGLIEGLLMLNFEPLTVGAAGYPELGQAGEGLWDAQHSHQLIHQLVIAVHPVSTEAMDLSIFGGQGSATIGPPIFMHRASSPGPSVPRKHHKGENPHETFPVVGASFRWHATVLEASAFTGHELQPNDSRFYPQVDHGIDSYAARLRHTIHQHLELQVSGARLMDQGEHSWQASASATTWYQVRRWRLDALIDWGLDHSDHHPDTAGEVFELAGRSPSRRDILWTRFERDAREEPERLGGGVSRGWGFETLGYERVLVVSPRAGLQLGLYAETTFVQIPASLEGQYGRRNAVVLDVGLHLFGMWGWDGSGKRMDHAAHAAH